MSLEVPKCTTNDSCRASSIATEAATAASTSDCSTGGAVTSGGVATAASLEPACCFAGGSVSIDAWPAIAVESPIMKTRVVREFFIARPYRIRRARTNVRDALQSDFGDGVGEKRCTNMSSE